MAHEVSYRPLISITNVIWSFDAVTKQLLVLLIQRDHAPLRIPGDYRRRI